MVQQSADIASAQQVNQFLADLSRQNAGKAPADLSLFSLRPVNEGKTAISIPDSDGKAVKYSLWQQKGPSGNFDQFVLVPPNQLQQIFKQQERTPLDAGLREKIQKSNGFANDDEVSQYLKQRNINIADGKVSVLDLVSRNLIGGFTGEKNWLGPDGKEVSLGNVQPHQIWTRLQPDGQRVVITEKEFTETTDIAKTKPQINWATQNYNQGDKVDESKLLTQGPGVYRNGRDDPAIEALYQQVTTFANATQNAQAAQPETTIQRGALAGSNLSIRLPEPVPQAALTPAAQSAPAPAARASLQGVFTQATSTPAAPAQARTNQEVLEQMRAAAAARQAVAAPRPQNLNPAPTLPPQPAQPQPPIQRVAPPVFQNGPLAAPLAGVMSPQEMYDEIGIAPVLTDGKNTLVRMPNGAINALWVQKGAGNNDPDYILKSPIDVMTGLNEILIKPGAPIPSAQTLAAAEALTKYAAQTTVGSALGGIQPNYNSTDANLPAEIRAALERLNPTRNLAESEAAAEQIEQVITGTPGAGLPRPGV